MTHSTPIEEGDFVFIFIAGHGGISPIPPGSDDFGGDDAFDGNYSEDDFGGGDDAFADDTGGEETEAPEFNEPGE